MANQGTKPTMDGIVRAKPIDGMGAPTPVPAPEPKPQPKAKATKPVPPPIAPVTPVPSVIPPAPVGEATDQVEAGPLAETPAKKSLLRKLIKIAFVLAVLAVLAAGVWWVYLSYFA